MEQGDNMSKIKDEKLEKNLNEINSKLNEMNFTIRSLFEKMKHIPGLNKDFEKKDGFDNLKKASDAIAKSISKDEEQLKLFSDLELDNKDVEIFDEKSKEILLKIDKQIKKMSEKISEKNNAD
jgi:hypothetical protein